MLCRLLSRNANFGLREAESEKRESWVLFTQKEATQTALPVETEESVERTKSPRSRASLPRRHCPVGYGAIAWCGGVEWFGTSSNNALSNDVRTQREKV